MPEEKRVRRTPQQIAQDLDAQMEKLNASIAELEEKKAASAAVFDGKIAAVKEKIKKLEARKKDVLAPKKRKVRKTKAQQIKDLVRKAQKAGPQAGRDCKPSWHFDGRINTQAGAQKRVGFPTLFFCCRERAAKRLSVCAAPFREAVLPPERRAKAAHLNKCLKCIFRYLK